MMTVVATAIVACSQVHRAGSTAKPGSAAVDQDGTNAGQGPATAIPLAADAATEMATEPARLSRAEVIGRLPELVQAWNAQRNSRRRFPEVDRRVDGAWRTAGARYSGTSAGGSRAIPSNHGVATIATAGQNGGTYNGGNADGGIEDASTAAQMPAGDSGSETAVVPVSPPEEPTAAPSVVAANEVGSGPASTNDRTSQMNVQMVGSQASNVPSWLFWLLWIPVALLVMGVLRYLTQRKTGTGAKRLSRNRSDAGDDVEGMAALTVRSMPDVHVEETRAEATATDAVSGPSRECDQDVMLAYGAGAKFDIVELSDDQRVEAIPGAAKLELDVGNETRAAISRYIEGTGSDNHIATALPAVAAVVANAASPEENDSDKVPEQASPDAPAPVLTEEDRRLNEILAAVQKAIAEENLGKALELLSPLSQQPDPPIGVLMAVGSVWWKMAEMTGSAESYGSAADAFARILAKEPDRQNLLRYRIGYCRLLQAQKQTGLQQIASLNDAVDHLNAAAQTDDGSNPRLLTDLGYALLQRSSLTLGDKREEYALAEQAFRGALKQGAPPDSDAAWLLQRVLRLRAGISQGAEAAAFRAEVDSLVAQALKNTDASHKSVWQASAVQNALEAVQGEGLSGASKRMRLREVQAKYRPWIVEGTSAPIMLSWVKLLSAEAEGLMGAARREKYMEAEQALKLTSFGEEQQGEMELRLMVAQMARLRSQLENLSIRLMLLAGADKQLQPYLDAPNSGEVKMEAANIALEQASLLRAPASQQAYKRAMALVEPLIETPSMEADALQCYLRAALMVEDKRDYTAAVLRMMELAPENSETWIIGARWALSKHDYEKASACCESAWQLGASRATLVPLWQQVNDDWTSSSETEDPTLAAAKRRLRKLKQVVK